MEGNISKNNLIIINTQSIRAALGNIHLLGKAPITNKNKYHSQDLNPIITNMSSFHHKLEEILREFKDMFLK